MHDPAKDGYAAGNVKEERAEQGKHLLRSRL
jgi:hypothetical protein